MSLSLSGIQKSWLSFEMEPSTPLLHIWNHCMALWLTIPVIYYLRVPWHCFSLYSVFLWERSVLLKTLNVHFFTCHSSVAWYCYGNMQHSQDLQINFSTVTATLTTDKILWSTNVATCCWTLHHPEKLRTYCLHPSRGKYGKAYV